MNSIQVITSNNMHTNEHAVLIHSFLFVVKRMFMFYKDILVEDILVGN